MATVPTSTPETTPVEPQIKRRLAYGTVLTVLLAASLGSWGALASLTSAVIAPGIVVVDSSDKKVQHPTGGIVSALLVKNGDKVNAGDVIIRLDSTQARANLGVITSQQTEFKARKSRLEAERDQAVKVIFPKDFEASAPDAAAISASERRLFDARMASKDGQKKQLRERIGQFRKEIEGLTVQHTAKKTEVELMGEEQLRVQDMRRRELVNVNKQLTTDREFTRLQGEEGALVSNIAKTEGQISEIEVQMISLDQTMVSESMKELREVEGHLSELAERRTAAQDQLDRIEIKAPRSGRVNELAVHTIGGVINPAETLMMIVPDDEKLAIEVHVAPTDVDQLAVGMPATLRFSAFNQRTTPEFKGEVTQIAANMTKEPQTGVSYYTARLAIAPDQEDKARQLKLVPGMPVETFVQTGERKAITYLLKPFNDQIARAFKED